MKKVSLKSQIEGETLMNIYTYHIYFLSTTKMIFIDVATLCNLQTTHIYMYA